jgi:uncharacterized membrane protein YkvA (DUF1232 family)
MHRMTGDSRGDAKGLERSERVVRREFWSKLASSLSRIPFAEKAVAAYFCAADPATPLRVKGTLFAALAYFVLPLDMVPDMILGLGFTDDMVVLATAFNLIRTHLRPRHLERARRTIERLHRADGG